ncbi:MAG: glycyl-radical enzyme activating protein [bacterium]
METIASTKDGSYATIFDIQRFSLHDGPGIRTTIFFKGCPIRCAWCQNPESHQTRPEIAFYAEQCKESYHCLEVCPNDAVLTGKQHRVDYAKCNSCGECASACVFGALRIIGREWCRESLIGEILKDKDYFLDSGGGVTLSGGEPMMQVEFLQKFLPSLKSHRIHVNIETCGVLKWEKMAKVIPFLDLIYYDLKHMNPKIHKKHTGVDNRIILSNFEKLAKVFPNLQARMPVIPGINDDRENIFAVAQFLKRNGQHSIHCLPYHNLGQSKLIRINSGVEPLQVQSITSKDIQPVKEMFEEQGIHAVVYD